MFGDDNDNLFEEDLYDDRDIDNDDLVDGLDFGGAGSGFFGTNKAESNSNGLLDGLNFGQRSSSVPNSNASNSGVSTSGCLIFILALPIATLLLIMNY